jgi:hypothetical protein
LALAALVTAWMVRSRAVKAAMVVLALVFLIPSGYLFSVFHPELVDGLFRTYKAFYGDIQIGMTRDEVFAALDRRYPRSNGVASKYLTFPAPTP